MIKNKQIEEMGAFCNTSECLVSSILKKKKTQKNATYTDPDHGLVTVMIYKINMDFSTLFYIRF